MVTAVSKLYSFDGHESFVMYRLWAEVLNESQFTDVELTYSNFSFYLHSSVVIACCPFLKKFFLETESVFANQKMKLDFRNLFSNHEKQKVFSAENIRLLLKFIYLGKINLTQANVLQVENLAELFQQSALLSYCADFKAFHCKSISNEHIDSTHKQAIVVLINSQKVTKTSTQPVNLNHVEDSKLSTSSKNNNNDSNCSVLGESFNAGKFNEDKDTSCRDDKVIKPGKNEDEKTTESSMLCLEEELSKSPGSNHLPLHCSHCNKIFFDRMTLKRHCSRHGNRGFECGACGRRYATEGGLKVHEKSAHQSLREFRCRKCGKMFGQKGHLVAHGRVHSGEKPHVCSFCGLGLCSKVNLRRHESSHTGDRPFQCGECPKSFAVQQDLDRHRKFLHSGDKVVCDVCGLVVQSRHSLKVHARVHASSQKRHTGKHHSERYVSSGWHCDVDAMHEHATMRLPTLDNFSQHMSLESEIFFGVNSD